MSMFHNVKNVYDRIASCIKNYLSSPPIVKLKSKFRYWWNKWTWRSNMLVEGGKTLFSRFKLLSYIAGCALVCYCSYKLMQSNWDLVEAVYSDTTMVGLLGTLLGAVIGGIFTLLGSVTVSKQQIKAQNQIRRKNVIYKPLYDELVEIHNDILVQNPFPGIIQFKKGTQTMTPHPQFSVWGRIKSDSRYLETPRKLTRLMDILEDEVKSYQRCYNDSLISIDAVFNCVLQRETGSKCSICNIAECVLSQIMSHQSDTLLDHYTDCLVPANELTKTERVRISRIIVSECWECESVNKLNRAYQAWMQTEEQAIRLLASMIRQVNISYEE